MKILVVEDEPKVLELMLRHFQEQGHEAIGSDTCPGAMALLPSCPDVAFVDLWLKGSSDGRTVLKELRRVSPGTKAVIVTGTEAEDPPEEEMVQFGAVACLKKPIRLDDLDNLLQDLSRS